MQLWVSAFNSCKPQGMKMPMWMMLKNVPKEYPSNSYDMPKTIRVVLGQH